jgi:hypothetical protein
MTDEMMMMMMTLQIQMSTIQRLIYGNVNARARPGSSELRIA